MAGYPQVKSGVVSFPRAPKLGAKSCPIRDTTDSCNTRDLVKLHLVAGCPQVKGGVISFSRAPKSGAKSCVVSDTTDSCNARGTRVGRSRFHVLTNRALRRVSLETQQIVVLLVTLSNSI
jgi:hypothetical protein